MGKKRKGFENRGEKGEEGRDENKRKGGGRNELLR